MKKNSQYNNGQENDRSYQDGQSSASGNRRNGQYSESYYKGAAYSGNGNTHSETGTSYQGNGVPYQGAGRPYPGDGNPYGGPYQESRDGRYPGGVQPGYPGGGGSGKDGRQKKKRSRAGDVLSGLLMIVALGVFLYSGYTLYGFYKEYKKGSDEYDNLENIYAVVDEAAQTENLADLENEDVQQMVEGREVAVINEDGEEKTVPVMYNPIDFEELKTVNEDIVGWLKIRALDISYPVVQAEDNDYYLHRTFERTDNFAGCLFMNCDNRSDFTDQNTIIYGHNMKNGSMFGKLKKFNEEETFKKSAYFWIFAPDIIYQYQIFSAMTVNKTGLTYQTFFTEEDHQTLIDTALERSVVDNTGIEVTKDDRIVTLSTCTGDDATRFVVMGRLAQVYAAKR